ncbi:MAG TPA: hypothetical protein VG326_08540 [Tepidisphaeraceae bacterium]|jgi:hypothetical protein|nr:hypothetical protein [Tepidisphaeraceae bacterium]
MSISALLDQRLTIQRQQLTADASGGSVRTFATILSSVPCAVSPAKSAVVAEYGRRDILVDHHIFTTIDLESALAGGIRLGDRLTDGVVYYLVKGVLKSSNLQVSNEMLYQVDCERRL